MNGLFAQKTDFKIKVETSVINNQNNYSVSIEILQGSPSFSIYLYDKEPLENGKVIAKVENINDYKYTFNNLKAPNYYICIKDKNKSIVGKWIKDSNN
jgi:hypothetical protein